MLDWPVLEFLPLLLRGAVTSLEITATATLLGLSFAFLAALARISRSRVLRVIAAVYVEVFRGTSALVQIFYFFYVLPFLGLNLDAFLAGVLALSLNQGAYGTEVVRAAVLGVDRGQREAAIALNMSPFVTLRRIILPQALVAMLPPFGNLVIETLKASSLLSLITITDLAFAGKQLLKRTGDITVVYLLVLLIYWVMSLGIAELIRRAEIFTARQLHLGPAR